LIGGSFALAARRALPKATFVGWDFPPVLLQAATLGMLQEGYRDLPPAIEGADLIYVALPIGVALEQLPLIVKHARADALVTDACSTKVILQRAAAIHFRDGARFLGGHPLAGRETGGVEQADAGLFRGARYALIAREGDPDPRVRAFAQLVQDIGAEPVWMDAETHDWAAGIVSHLPQLVSVALAGVIRDETDETGLPLSLAGPGLRDALRLAGSSYAMWRDICMTNSENLARALDRMAQAIEHLRANLRTREMQEQFRAANEVCDALRRMK